MGGLGHGLFSSCSERSLTILCQRGVGGGGAGKGAGMRGN